MPADDGFWPHDGDRLEHRAEEASGESEDDATSRTKAGLGTERYDPDGGNLRVFTEGMKIALARKP